MSTDKCRQCGTAAGESVDGLCHVCQSSFGATIMPDPQATHLSQNDAATSNDTAAAGDLFGDYELLEEVARGGMGVIYKARHTKLNRITALKMILSGRFSSRDELQRFHVEAEAAASLDHPGIVPFYEIGEVDGQAFFAMKFVEGGALAARLDEVRSEPREAIRMLSKVGRAVHHAHQRGILHRDLKPANILMDVGNEPLITDLGLAKKTQGKSNLTNTGAVMGTPSYMPPEQASGKGAVTTAADIYSLGAILYELLTGQPPYKGESAVDTVMQVLNGPPRPPRQVESNIDRNLELICLKCLERHPDDRYATAQALSTDLDSWLNGDSISVSPPSLVAKTQRWLHQNYRLAYIAFAVFAGMLLTAPFLMEFVTQQAYVQVYDRYPHLERPWLFSTGKLPEWTQFIVLGILLGLGSSIGFLTAAVTRPRNALRAFGAGALTSLVLYVTFVVFLGWMPLMLNTNSAWRVRRLATVIWPPNAQSTAEERLQLAEEIFPGLSEIPIAERAGAATALMEGDQLAQVPGAMLVITFIFFLVSLPMIQGTVIGWYLQNRFSKGWVIFLRYQLLWWLGLMPLAFAVNAAVGVFGQQFLGPPPERFGPVVSVIVATVLYSIGYLVARRWHRPKAG